jgi:hypothetical protein
MNCLLASILDAHGGMDRWNGYDKVEARIVSGGGFFALKNVLQDANPRRMTVWLHEEHSSVWPYGAPDQRTMFTPELIAIEKLDGTRVAERPAPRDSFCRASDVHAMGLAASCHFNGEALWTYLTTPFLVAMEGVRIEETEPWREGAETWRVLRAYFPGSIETHSLVQDFFFGEDLVLRRHDYSVNIAGGFPAAQLTTDYVVANGIRLPTKRRALHARARSPADSRHADGFDRYRPGELHMIRAEARHSPGTESCRRLRVDVMLGIVWRLRTRRVSGRLESLRVRTMGLPLDRTMVSQRADEPYS